MSDIRLDPTTGDLDVSDFIAPRMFAVGEELAAIAQQVAIRLRTFLGEWFADTTKGVPWLQQILGGKNLALAVTLLREVVQMTPGVLSITQLDVSFDDARLLTLTLRATTTAGPLDMRNVPLQSPTPTGALWTPLAIGNDLAFWYDPADASTLTLTGARVNAMRDKGPNAYHLAPQRPGFIMTPSINLAVNSPVLAGGLLTFNGVEERNISKLGGTVLPSSIFFVIRFDGAPAPLSDMHLIGAGSDTAAGYEDGKVLSMNAGGAFTSFDVVAAPPATASMRTNGSPTSQLFANPMPTNIVDITSLGILELHGNNLVDLPLVDGFSLGAGVYAGGTWNGAIGEVVGVFGTDDGPNGALRTKLRRRVEGHLAHRAGIQSRLPADHPYRLRAPTIDD